MTGSSSSNTAESPASLIADTVLERPEQRPMNAAEPTVGHEHDDIPIAMLAHDGRDDVLVIRKVARPLPLRSQIRYEPIAIQTISFRQRRPEHCGKNHFVRGSKRRRKSILEHTAARRRGAWLEDGPDASIRISVPQRRERLIDRRRVMREVVKDRNSARHSHDFEATLDA